MPITNAQIAQQQSELVSAWSLREDEMRDWLSGSATGGPYSDGRYPLTDFLGTVYYVKCPARLELDVSGPTGSAQAAQAAAEAALADTIIAQNASVSAQGFSESARDASLAARDLAEQHKLTAATSEANSLVHRQAAALSEANAQTSEASALVSETKAATSATAAATSETNAAASAAAAATFNPALYAALSGAAFTGDVSITGSLDVTGAVNFINSNQVDIGDSILTLNAAYAGSTPIADGGLEINRGTLPSATLKWNETGDQWEAQGFSLWHSGNFDPSGYSLTSHDHAGIYAPSSHSHNDLYYTEAEVDGFLAGKADTHTHPYASDTHNHDADYAPLGHTHGYLPLAGGTLSGTLTVQQSGDVALSLRVPAGEANDWNYISFYGADGVWDGYAGTDAAGNMIVTTIGGSSLTLKSTSIIANYDLFVNSSKVWHAGNLDPSTFALTTHSHDAAYSPIGHTHSYLPLAGGTLSGTLTAPIISATGGFAVKDTRLNGDTTPDGFTDKAMTLSFTDDITGSVSTWDSMITMKGWTDGYRAWQLIASSEMGSADTALYYRSGIGTTWGPKERVLTDAGTVRSTLYSSGMAAPRWDTSFYVLQSQHWHGHTSTQTMYLGEAGNTVEVRGLFVKNGGEYFYPGNSDADIVVNAELANRATGSPDTVGDGRGFSVDYMLGAAVNKPTGVDHSLLTMAYSPAYQTQLAGDWRTNKWYVRGQDAGVWSSWAEVLTSLGGTLTGSLGLGVAPASGYKLTVAGSLHMKNTDINYVNQLHFNDNVRLYDDGNVQHLNLKSGDAAVVGLKLIGGDGTLRGRLYSNVPTIIGLTTSNGTWGMNCFSGGMTQLHYAGATKLQTTSAGVSIVGLLDVDSIRTRTTSARVKLGVWSGSLYGIGMGNAYTYGDLNDFAMTFQMNSTANRGFWWGQDAHTNAQGAMALTNDGRLTVDKSIKLNGKGSVLCHAASAHASGSITVSAAAPTGGADGDVWMEV